MSFITKVFLTDLDSFYRPIVRYYTSKNPNLIDEYKLTQKTGEHKNLIMIYYCVFSSTATISGELKIVNKQSSTVIEGSPVGSGLVWVGRICEKVCSKVAVKRLVYRRVTANSMRRRRTRTNTTTTTTTTVTTTTMTQTTTTTTTPLSLGAWPSRQ